jgi:acid phosphatase type 7
VAADAAASAAAGDYVAPGSEFAYVPVLVELPAELMGQAAMEVVERGGHVGSGTVSPVIGQARDQLPPPGWAIGEPEALRAMRRGRAPFAAADGERGCDCATAIADNQSRRVAALFAVRRFTIGSELKQLRGLNLRVRYRDGLIVRVNGQEVARRFIERNAEPTAFATRARGPEWEDIFIPAGPGLLRAGSNWLAVEVRPSARLMAPVLDLSLRAATAARIVRGPMVQRVTSDAATVVFETDLPVRGTVQYGPGPELGISIASAGGALAVRHVVELRDLPPGQAVHYQVVAEGRASPVYSFPTAPVAPAPLRLAVYGDVRGGHEVHSSIAMAMLREAPDMVVATGDLVVRGTDEGDWQRFFAVSGELLARVPYYPAVGNHDLGRSGDELRRMNEIFALWPGPDDRPEWGHWYSFTIRGVHFVMLDSNAYEHEVQRAWLERDLTQARQRGVEIIFAFTHAGPYSRGVHGNHAYAIANYVPILVRHRVTTLFSGHDHIYQRGTVDGLSYVVTGGGGAPLYPVRCGVAGRPRCSQRDGMKAVASEHHYVMTTVFPTHVELCPKRSDGSALEPCWRIKSKRAQN